MLLKHCLTQQAAKQNVYYLASYLVSVSIFFMENDVFLIFIFSIAVAAAAAFLIS